MLDLFEENEKLLSESLQHGLADLRQQEIRHTSNSLLTKNYKVRDRMWKHAFECEWKENYERANVRITFEYLENSPHEVVTKLAGGAGKQVVYKGTKMSSPKEVLQIGVGQYILKLLKEAKCEINESI